MEIQTIRIPEFRVVGIQIRTTNENGQSQIDIAKLWKRFYTESIQSKISNKLDADVIGLYTDYAGDFTRPYTMIIGCRVSSIDDIPEDMVGKVIPSAQYAIFKVKGKLPDELIYMWQQIWSSDISRAYTSDFEVYGEKSVNQENAEMEVYLSIK